MQNLKISQQEHNLAGTDNHVHNPFTQAHDTLDTLQLMTLNMPLSTLITIQVCHLTVSTQLRSLPTTVKQTKTIC